MRFVFLTFLFGALASAQVPSFTVVSIGDSLGEGVQSGDANSTTQPYSYPNFFTALLGIDFPVPLIQSNALGIVGNLDGRSRIDPQLLVANVAVSGATVGDLLRDSADGYPDAEIDLVMEPYRASQIEAAEAINSALVLCWVGSNDALQAVTSFSALNASQLTPVATFQADYHELVQRLSAAGRFAVFGNIPDLDKIAFLIDRDDLIRFLGQDYGLPVGSKTSALELLLLKAGFDDGTNLQNPDYVLDPDEQAIVQQRIEDFNQIIANEAASVGMPVVDINGAFDEIASNPPIIGGTTLRTNFLGGLFSLDGVHPSVIGNALISNLFLEAIGDHYGSNLPTWQLDFLNFIAQVDPFVDGDGDGSVPGRPFTSLLETLAYFAGFSGDSSNAAASITSPVDSTSMLNAAREALGKANGKKASGNAKQDVTDALELAFGVKTQPRGKGKR